MMMRVWSIIFLLVFFIPKTADARIPILEGEDAYVDLSGYVQSVSGVQYLTYELPPPMQETTGINAEVIRLEWAAQLGEKVHIDVHNRLFFRISTAPSAAAGASIIGLGATAEPGRSLDLSTSVLDENGILLNHDIDRAAVTVYTEAADVTVGRQAIVWGRSILFPVADLWAQFSPFELDRTQKRGTDAIRVLAYPNYSTELDLVLADKGSLDNLSGGARLSHNFDWGDGFVAAGKFWNEIIAMAGVSITSGHFRGRLEIAEPYDLDADELKLPRATIGGDFLSADTQVSLEYHFNGAGAAAASGYLAQLQSPVFSRGESYFLGRHYLGALLSYAGFERTRLALSLIGNLADPSIIVAPSFRYILSDEADINLGAFQGFGRAPELKFPPELRSEYGTYGGFVFSQLRVFF
jgi:hypothetical protein